MTYEKPLPQINADTREFWEGCRQHLIKIQQCGDCGFLRFPPSFICPRCHSRETHWITATGRGSVYTFTINHVAFHPAFQGD
ncbi:MAG: hypothetical protein JXI32_02880, partial [Deltaproteobacteria bacterium]|nr:hypothetical protein [Deltaproteobacteria bacterium]